MLAFATKSRGLFPTEVRVCSLCYAKGNHHTFSHGRSGMDNFLKLAIMALNHLAKTRNHDGREICKPGFNWPNRFPF